MARTYNAGDDNQKGRNNKKFELNLSAPEYIVSTKQNEENENSTVQQPIKCYNCGGKGHMRRDCWYSPGNANEGYQGRVVANVNTKPYRTNISKDSDAPNETRFHIIIKWKDTKYKMLVDTGATHSYISKQFFKQIKELDYEVKKPNNDKLIVANGQKLQTIGQVLIPIEVGHVKEYLLFRLVPELRSIGIPGTDTMERLGLILDFEKKIWWLPEKPQIRYKIEANSQENRVIWNEEEKERKSKKDSLEERMKVGNKIKLRNQ